MSEASFGEQSSWEDVGRLLTQLGAFFRKAARRLDSEFLQAFTDFTPFREAVAATYRKWALRLVQEAFGVWVLESRWAQLRVYDQRKTPTHVMEAMRALERMVKDGREGPKLHVQDHHFTTRSCSTNIVQVLFANNRVLYVRFGERGDVYWDIYGAAVCPITGDGPCELEDMVAAVKRLF